MHNTINRCLCVLLIIVMTATCFSGLAESEKKGGFFGAAGDFLDSALDGVGSVAGDVGEWASGAANDVGDWATGAANDVGDWASGAASDVGKWATDTASDVGEWASGAAQNAGRWIGNAAEDVGNWAVGAYHNTVIWAGNAAAWAGDTASEAGKWLATSATGAWDWTVGAASDTWIWASTTAENAWAVTSKTVSGTWNSIFGNPDDNKGPHHLCISSPLLSSVELLDSRNDEYGNIVECYKYDNEYDITIIATNRAEEIMPPSVGEIGFSDLVSSCYDTIGYVDQNAEGVGVRAMAQELRFKAILDDVPKFGRALGVWTDHYIVAFIITADVEFYEDDVDIEGLKDADGFFDLWMETLSIYETKQQDIDLDKNVEVTKASGNMTASNLKTSSRLYFESTFHSTYGGKGFAAEGANTLADNIRDVFKGRRAEVIVGNDNERKGNNGKISDKYEKNAADRRITDKTGITLIQSKYHKTAKGSIGACFENGEYKYLNSDGQPMMVEVPSDQYDDAVAVMRRYIEAGKVPGVTDPEQATTIVRKGTVTYKQACRIAKAGNIDSLVYDSVNACVESAYSFGISTTVQFAVSIWNGENLKNALKLSVYTGLKVGGTSFVISVLSSQLSKAGLNSLLRGSSEAVVKLMGPKASAVIANAFRTGNHIYGAAAMKNVARLLRSNTITAVVSMVILTVPDVIEIFRGRISAKQLMKNVAQTGAGLAGGMGGWYGGAALGSLVFPGVGTIIGGIIGSVGGGYVVQMATGKLADLFAEDDAEEMIDIISLEFESMAEEYLLNEEEVKNVVDKLNHSLDANRLKDMYASSNREGFAREVLLRPLFNEIAENRIAIEIPTEKEYKRELIEVLEEIYDEEEALKEAA